jgi:hypothetical protein
VKLGSLGEIVLIDVDFDSRLDARGKDPDSASPTLRNYHQMLWSKPLPNGRVLELKQEAGKYLVHRSDLGEHFLASDSISNSLRAQKRKSALISQIPSDQLDAFQKLGSTIGAKTLFPGNKVDGLQTINAARGFNPKIADRIDLTLHCIRSHYQGEPSPLSATLGRYSSFFELFENFEGFTRFFLLEDLLDGEQIRYFLPFENGFDAPALPTTVPEYFQYMKNTMDFVGARNLRIQEAVLHLD